MGKGGFFPGIKVIRFRVPLQKTLVLIKTFCQQNKTTSFISLCRSRYLKKQSGSLTCELHDPEKKNNNNNHRNVKT
jgi:hypothetical protein